MTAQAKSQPRETATPNPSSTEPRSAVSRVAHEWDATLPNRCGPTCVRPTPSQAHCAARGCGRTFGGITGFDAHRKDGQCLDPATLGMVRSEAGVWRTPMSDEDRARRFGGDDTAGREVAT